MKHTKILLVLLFFFITIISIACFAKEKPIIIPIADDRLNFIFNNISYISYLVIANLVWLLFVMVKAIFTYIWNKNEKRNDKTQEKLDFLIEVVNELRIKQGNFVEKTEITKLVREEFEYRESFEP